MASTAVTLIAQFTIPGTEATIAITQTAPDMFQVVYDAPEELGGSGSFLGERNEQKAREVANHVWSRIVGLRNVNNAYTNRDQQVPGLPGVTYGEVAAAFSDTGAEPHNYTAADYRRDATGTPRPTSTVTIVKGLRAELAAALHALVSDAKHDKYRMAVTLPGEDKLRFFRVDTPRTGKWAGAVFVKEQAGDELYPVKPVGREIRVLQALLVNAQEALVRYGLELGHCGICGRTLTDEESRARGIGPVCIDKL